MRRTVYCTVPLIALLAWCCTASADETVENPEYKKWAIWKEGSYSTLRGENKYGDTTAIVTTTHTVKSISADKIVIEIKTVTENNGQKSTPEPTTYDIPAREPKLPDDVRKQFEEQTKALAASFKQTKGKETLTINGRKLDCEWVRTEGPGNDNKGWSSPDVPGETVKTEMAAGPLKSSVQLIDWKGEKR